jgi:Family of unknown function (DUF5706)
MKELSALLPDQSFTDEHPPHTKVDLARHLFTSLEYQVQVADRKVQVVFSLNAFLVAAISFQSQQPMHALLQNNISLNTGVDLMLKAGLLACVCIATFSAIKALTPRTRINAINDNKPLSLFFFRDIGSRTKVDFLNSFVRLTNAESIKEILSSVHSISQILGIKYKYLNRSTLFLSIALFIWILLQVNKFLN